MRAVVLLVLLVAVLASTTAAQSCRKCAGAANASMLTFPANVGTVFNPFTAAELDAIAAYVRTKLKLLDEIPSDGVMGNYLYSVDWMADEKARVLGTIDQGRTYAGRYAKAVVFYLATEKDACVTEYRVGPIARFPIATSVAVTALRWPGNYRHTTKLPATMRPTISTDYVLMENVVAAAMTELANLTMVSYGVSYEDKDFYWTDSAPRGYTNMTRQTWIWFVWAREGMFALPIGLNMLIDHKPLDPTKWSVLELSYGGQGPFKSVAALAGAFNRGTLAITKYAKPAKPSTSSPLFSSMRRRGASRPLESNPMPRVVQEGGARFAVSGRQVKWSSWDLHIGFELIAGIRFNDIRFRNERIVYELALQDAYASYSGASVVQALSQYSDAGWGMGWTGRQLVIGVDCPSFATLMSTEFFVGGVAGSNVNNICIWEQPDNIAIMRHYDFDFYGGSGGYTSVAAVPRTTLVIRTTSTVYNYDYYYNYIFYADGTIKVEALASGYLQAELNPRTATLRNAEMSFQSVVNSFTSGNLHDHIFNYKIDLDVQGMRNSLMAKKIKVRTYNIPWNFDGKLTRMKYVEHTTVAREGVHSWYNDDSRTPVSFMICNETRKNKWGAMRGYGIHLGSPFRQLIDVAPWMPSQQWTKYNVAVTRRRDSEPKSGYPLYDMQAPANPILNFDSLLNGESLRNEDLVAWVSIGNHHIPSAEDIPVTTTAHTALHFLIKPMNYFDESPVTDLNTRFYKTGNMFKDTTALSVNTANTAPSTRCVDDKANVMFTDSPTTG